MICFAPSASGREAVFVRALKTSSSKTDLYQIPFKRLHILNSETGQLNFNLGYIKDCSQSGTY